VTLSLIDLGQQKRFRRTKAEMGGIREAIIDILNGVHPQTIRQVFYQLVARVIIEKLEKEYKGTVIRLLTEMRMDDTIPFEWIVDQTHDRVVYRTHNSLAEAARNTARFYRRNALAECSDYLEIYVDKQALSGFVHEAAGEYDVPVVPGGTFLSPIHESAVCIRRAWQDGKKSYIYQFGDYDATGLVTARSAEKRLVQICTKLGCPPPIFERIALTPAQIKKYDLPTRPSKTFEEGNRHAKSVDFKGIGKKGESVELDALPAAILKQLVTDVIERHIDPDTLAILREAEESERQLLKSWASRIEKRAVRHGTGPNTCVPIATTTRRLAGSWKHSLSMSSSPARPFGSLPLVPERW
jgi:hypothetical protein